MEVDITNHISDKSDTNVDTLLVNKKNEDPKASDIESNKSSTEEEGEETKSAEFTFLFKYYSYLNSKHTHFSKVTFQK